MRIVGVMVLVQLIGCSFAMQRPPTTSHVTEEVPCSESYAASGFDATIAASALIVGLIAATSYQSHKGCGDPNDYSDPSCSFYDWNFVGSAAALVGFGVAAYSGNKWAGQCRAMHDEHDHWVATQLSPEDAKQRNMCLVERARAAEQVADPEQRARLVISMPCGETATEQAKLRNVCLIERHKISAQLNDPLEAQHLIISMPCGDHPGEFKSPRVRSEYGGLSGGLLGGLLGLVLGSISLQPHH